MLNDCTLPDEQTGTTQIDHILLSPYGIFIIETKNYQGWIFGGERQKHWTQKIYKNLLSFKIRYIRTTSTLRYWSQCLKM